MAKYEIKHTCGHTLTKELFGKNKGFRGREEKIDWLESQPCWDCKKKEETDLREKQSLEAQEKNLEAGFLEMEGSEKQILWAETIRAETIIWMNEEFLALGKSATRETRTLVAKTSEWLKEIKSSKWWIGTIGTLKSNEGTAHVLAMLSDGKLPKASRSEVLKKVFTESPFMNENQALLFHITKDYNEKIQKGLQAEQISELEKSKPATPEFLKKIREEAGSHHWNGKIYSGRRIFLANQEFKITKKQEAELTTAQKSLLKWAKEMEGVCA